MTIASDEDTPVLRKRFHIEKSFQQILVLLLVRHELRDNV
jgi:hypothetical protein